MKCARPGKCNLAPRDALDATALSKFTEAKRGPQFFFPALLRVAGLRVAPTQYFAN